MKKTLKRKTLKQQLRVLIIAVGIPFLCMIIVVQVMVFSFNREYLITLQNATTAGEFNLDFKENLDLDMYYFVVGSINLDHLPLDEVENAENVIRRLQKTTTNKENIWRVKSLLRLCDRLSECMLNIQETESYDDRMEMLDHDIYILTDLIQTYMTDYIYYEVKDLSAIQEHIRHRGMMIIGMTAVISGMCFLCALWYAMVISKKISHPLGQLCKKVENLGKGDFAVLPIVSVNAEIATLDEGFNVMADHINQLLERVKDNQNALRKAEFELLQAQINPHFLYNALDSIIWLAESHQDKEVILMTSNLSTFFQTSLSKGRDIITLAIEKQQVESYLKIQKVRYSDILVYHINIPDSILQYNIPKLTLQPLVENALYHGVKNKRSTGYIEVRGIEKEEDILLQVIDDGAGMTQEQLEELRAGVYEDKHTGLGLVNVHNRLRLYYGSEYGLSFESQTSEGTIVTVRIPKKKA